MERLAIAFCIAIFIGVVMQVVARAVPRRLAWTLPTLIAVSPFLMFAYESVAISRGGYSGPGVGGLGTLLYLVLIWPGLILGYGVGWAQQTFSRWRTARQIQNHGKKD